MTAVISPGGQPSGSPPRPASYCHADDLVVVANRLPVEIDHARRVRRSPGGLASALSSVTRPGSQWVGWSGSSADLVGRLRDGDVLLRPVPLTPAEVRGYYHGFANSVLWPLFHGRLHVPEMNRSWWRTYRTVNHRFASTVARVAPAGGVVWVHDYHLLLVPAMLRARRPDLRVGLFVHIPFPHAQLFASLPWRRELLLGMGDAHLLGFQTDNDVDNFHAAADQLLRHRLRGRRRRIEVDAFPISVDVDHWSSLGAVNGRAGRRHRRSLGDRFVFLGVDRLDYTKGIVQRLQAFGELLDDGALRAEGCAFVQVAVPSRTAVAAYRDERVAIEALVATINARHGRAGAPEPIRYIDGSLDETALAGWYRAADALVVTSLADGMNLVAKEFVASRTDLAGTVILSEFAGAAHDLPGALIVNPYDVDAVKRAMLHAWRTPRAEQATRMVSMRQSVFGHDVHAWAKSFLERLDGMRPRRVPPALVS